MANTVIGSSIVIDGEISGEEAIVVQGTVKGRIAISENLYLENSSALEADVEANTIEVSGSVTGNLSAQTRVILKADAKMIGDVRSPRIEIADGAIFKGQIDMDVER
ncbi:polymer-forming cytoskeletal protein [Myxococcota bacterium]|nr:polymer-forming cytoskeletal protein [Myxococcota bacterium]MBU1432750.1 polymer-forming cytoskeletal protein [Myxococcota bacterium]MBU1900582.1 polymer-forming cytoskeletal protein [Myxococcota bacterium]